MLREIGLESLICDSIESYIQQAIELATDAGKLNAIRDRLTKNLASEPLFDIEAFARKLERAYVSVVQERAQSTGRG